MTDKVHITLTHLNVRQSISILIAKLIVIDLIMAVVVALFFIAITQSESLIKDISLNDDILLVALLFIGIFKVFMSCYVILSWLNEYYELTPEYILHKHGIIFRKTEHYRLNHVREMKIGESFFGNLLNYATITLYEIRLQKYLDMYLIHNARRYAKVIKELRPQIEMKEDSVWIPFKRESEVLPHE